MKITWQLKKFEDLSPLELYKIMQLRAEVFVVEQNCVYQDVDGKDLDSIHLYAINDNNQVMAYCRLVSSGISYEEVSIGRVVTSPKVRGMGFGKELMDQALYAIKEMAGNVPIRIGAQCYLKKFYTDLGFIAEGEEYLEDNIPHIEMVYFYS